MWQAIQNWLKQNPKVAGAVQAAEAALATIVVGVLTGVIPVEWSKVGLRSLGVLILTNVGTALRNYYKQAPRVEWTPEQRAEAKTNGK